MTTGKEYVAGVFEKVKAQNAHEPEFLQAVEEVFESLVPVFDKYPKYIEENLLERLVEPERIITFRVPWVDDKGQVQVNRGFRVQFSSAIGPYKGGLRFHPSVNQSIIKFLGFEQIFKNSLTGQPIGGGKGGSNFDPKGKSDNEIMRFCQSFMTELSKHIGADTDVPAGDIGVGAREIGYLYGQYKRLRNEFTGVLTGKGPTYGGSLARPEATGFGVVYFAQEILTHAGQDIKGKTVAVSGFGNVSWGVVQKVNHLGGKVVTISGPDGYVYDEEGISGDEKINYMLEMRASGNNKVEDYAKKFPSAKFFAGKKPWEVKVDIAIPAATQNELTLEDAQALIANGLTCLTEAANMPCTLEAVEAFQKAGVLFGPAKAANAGGVAVSALEMSQNSQRLAWTFEEVDARLHTIMKNIYANSAAAAKEFDAEGNLVVGANIAGFLKVAEAMSAQGIV